jgi:hypothetical protein
VKGYEDLLMRLANSPIEEEVTKMESTNRVPILVETIWAERTEAGTMVTDMFGNHASSSGGDDQDSAY